MAGHLPKLRLNEHLSRADHLFLTITCRGCRRNVAMGVRRAVRLVGELTTDAWLARLRCSECGIRGTMLQVHADTRPREAFLRDGPLAVTQEA